MYKLLNFSVGIFCFLRKTDFWISIGEKSQKILLKSRRKFSFSSFFFSKLNFSEARWESLVMQVVNNTYDFLGKVLKNKQTLLKKPPQQTNLCGLNFIQSRVKYAIRFSGCNIIRYWQTSQLFHMWQHFDF